MIAGSGGTWSFQNALGLRLTAHRASGSSTLTAVKTKADEQTFYVDEVDYPYFKILAANGRSHGLDLTNASSDAGTTVGIWQYDEASNTTPTHRQWMLVPLTAPKDGTGAEPGDVNGDGAVDLTDAIMIVYYSLQLQQAGFNKAVADVNNDGMIDITDAIVVVYMSLEERP
jgi:hypothetical protein